MNSSIAQDYPEIPINILLIFGIPGSGKSFTAQKIKKRLTKDGHICFILDYDLLESQNPEKILEAEGKNLLELFEQQAVYLYNKSDSGNTVKKIFLHQKTPYRRSSRWQLSVKRAKSDPRFSYSTSQRRTCSPRKWTRKPGRRSAAANPGSSSRTRATRTRSHPT